LGYRIAFGIGEGRNGPRFPGVFRKWGDFFPKIHTGVSRGFLGIEKRLSRRGPVFLKETRFFKPSFCRGAFSNDYLIARHLMASH
jgi:hypothetical protein